LTERVDKKYFDVVIVTPLEEEFISCLAHFSDPKDVSTATEIRFEVSVPNAYLRIILVQQFAMGKTEAMLSCAAILNDFDVGIIVCLGIAGGISDDANIGDVCYSSNVIDVLDNAAITDGNSGDLGVSFSPTNYSTPRDVVIALNLSRVNPGQTEEYKRWQDDRHETAAKLLPDEFIGKHGKPERIQKPTSRGGTIVCGNVSRAKQYKEKLKQIDRKTLAIETESGGIFACAQERSVPAIAVRGIADYADDNKSHLEAATKTAARAIAASNAASFLAWQLANPATLAILERRHLTQSEEGRVLPLLLPPARDLLAETLTEIGADIDVRLRELSPAFGLQAKGYRLPIPRVRLLDSRTVAEGEWTGPIEVRDALRESRLLILTLPKEYPDNCLSWILANDLLTVQIKNKQLIPIVVEGNGVRGPGHGVSRGLGIVIGQCIDLPNTRAVFIIDDFKFESPTRTAFLFKEVAKLPEAIFVVVTRRDPRLLQANPLVEKASAAISRICNISFIELAYFLQKNFEMATPMSEVIALRLGETFNDFKLSAHPSYFAGIPRDVLNSLLDANKKAELIELAVAGYLSFVVADDRNPIRLSRTTRESFLTSLAVEINLRKREFSDADIVEFIESLKGKFDYNVGALEFLRAFFEHGILYSDGGAVRFSLPFMESYLLASALFANPSLASTYFADSWEAFDTATFSLYAELGPAEEVVANLSAAMDASIAELRAATAAEPILLGDSIAPAFLVELGRLNAIQKRLKAATEEVRNEADHAEEKQAFLDVANKIQDEAVALKASVPANVASRDKVRAAFAVLKATLTLLGSGAERLEARVKRKLIGDVIELTSLLLDAWTRSSLSIDFSGLRDRMTSDESMISRLAAGSSKQARQDAIKTLGGLVDLIECTILMLPTIALLNTVCEEARDKVLMESIDNVTVHGQIEQIVHSMWLTDISPTKGKKKIVSIIKKMPAARFLRFTMASQIMTRVYWRHWEKKDKLMLLDVAKEFVRSLSYRFDKRAILKASEDSGSQGDC